MRWEGKYAKPSHRTDRRLLILREGWELDPVGFVFSPLAGDNFDGGFLAETGGDFAFQQGIVVSIRVGGFRF